MNKSALIVHFNNPDRLSQSDSEAMNAVLKDYPYFQAARAVQLKALHEQKSYKYNQALKRTAAHTIDRQVLFEYITSPVFVDLDRESAIDLEEIEVFDVETIQALHKKITDELEIEEKNKKENKDAKEKLESQVSDMLEIGQPIAFKKSEPHSFNEWMQLISKKPLRTDKQLEATSEKTQANDKNELIERFIQSNPKIGTIDKSAKNVDITIDSHIENESLMTETLAKVYLEQRKFENAIKAYRILSLKYPEKSGFFADRIKAIKILQKNKS